MKRLTVFLAFIFTVRFARAQHITGDWHGTLQTGMGELRLVLPITQAPDCILKTTLDSVDQPGAKGIPAQSITLTNCKLNLDVAAVHGTYDGNFSAVGPK